ncbi:NADPH:quinone reductase-like Zn-dependent oxidoreductase [Alteromonadaceae bacterium 2753L.S.0a.02]|nr:NADPH:quinone reductase-like Zn-dependent oxidoreductase [Alteromonadaceae bacterium 2753L.S.0a.02]
MKAVSWNAYGAPDVLALQDVAIPRPTKNQLLIKVHASAVTSGDCRLRAFQIPRGFWLPARLAFGIFKPRCNVPGMNLAGEVISVGSDVTEFSSGDRVFGSTGMALGAHAEYACVAEQGAIVKLPESIDYSDAAAIIFGGLTAVHFLRDCVTVKAGSRILINGASGAVGTAAVALANHFGGVVTAVCSEKKHDLARALGAEDCLDYRKVDFTQQTQNYDLILDAVGNVTLKKAAPKLKPGGKLILINGGCRAFLHALFNKTLLCGVAPETKEMLLYIADLLERGVFKAVIDKTFLLDEVIAAHRYVDTGRKCGNVILLHRKNHDA